MRGVVASAALLLSCAVAVLAAGALVDPVLPATFTPGPVPPLNAPPNGYFAEVPVAFFPAGAAVSSFTHDPCNGWFWTVMEHAAGGTVEAVSLMRVVPPPSICQQPSPRGEGPVRRRHNFPWRRACRFQGSGRTFPSQQRPPLSPI